MKNFLLEQQQKEERIAILTKFIQSNPEARELKRALAVKMALEGESYAKITQLLSVNKSSITTWKQRFEARSIDGIKLGYKGARSYLTSEQRVEVITWLRQKNYWNLDELVAYLDENYGVIYRSKQSYYELLTAAGINWKKSQKVNPSSDPGLIKKKREEILDFLSQNQAEIEAGRLVIFFGDECHLLGDDVCGYVWAAAFGGKLPERVLGGIMTHIISYPETCLGKTDIRIEILIKNTKERQTYFGALDYQKYWHLCKSFAAVKWLFKFFTNYQKFDFSKLHQYAPCS